MDTRRSWLWRRKSSEKSSGETESSGSISSHSGRFSDEQAYPNHNALAQSPEVTSKAAPINEEVIDGVTLSEKLSAALLSINAKEELVNQHAKVAEEAVSGWEKAENEVSSLKYQLEAVTQKNTALEDRVGHLDGALKECMRQLRQAREEQQQKIQEAVTKKELELEFVKSKYENQLGDLQAQLQNAKATVLSPIESDAELRATLEALEKENSALKLEVLSRAEEVEIRIIERELSTQAAETASKQLLESIKKVARLEAENLRLKTVARKASLANDYKSLTASSVYVESFTDSQSDCGERLMAVDADVCKMNSSQTNGFELGHSDSWASPISKHNKHRNDKLYKRNLMVPSVEINLMDDFLEMERLVMLPNTDSESSVVDLGAVSDQPISGESQLKVELGAMIHQTAALEEKLERTHAGKAELNMALMEYQEQLEVSQIRLKEANAKLVELGTQLALANESARAAEEEVVVSNEKKVEAESRCRRIETEIETLHLKVCSLEQEVGKEKSLSVSINEKREVTESQLRRAETEIETLLAKITLLEDDRKMEQSLSESTNEKRKAVESQLRCAEAEIETLLVKVTSLEDELKKEKSLSESSDEKREVAESQLRCVEAEFEGLLAKVNLLEEELKKEKSFSEASDAKRQVVKSKLRRVEAEIEILVAKHNLLEEEHRKERSLSAENVVKCQKLEHELSRIKGETELKREADSYGDLKINQEEELAVAANRFAECQKTIASLGRQLKSLATLEDFLLDSEKPLEFGNEESWSPDKEAIAVAF